MQSPSIPKGTRDFLPVQMNRRMHIIRTIEEVYRKYGFMPIETPAMENISTLTGKYGEEGDKLLFRVLNSGDFLAKTTEKDRESARDLLPKIADKGLRYDLTVPLARFVVQNRNELQFPFRRYQVQPVWRADRPQKGRYREFWQCDADIIGSASLTGETDLVCIYREVFTQLGIRDYQLKINHRKVLEAVAQIIGYPDRFQELTVAIDKFDKIGFKGVSAELEKAGFSQDSMTRLEPFLAQKPLDRSTVDALEAMTGDVQPGKEAVRDLRTLIDLLDVTGSTGNIYLDGTLARGLDYYTGCIFEVTVPGSGVGSVSGGGRYDDLTGVFGLDGMPGVGISFGIDRIYDVMEERQLFGEIPDNPSRLLICHFNESSLTYGMEIAYALRTNGIACEVYPDHKKINKQFDYANKRGFPYVAVIGDEEIRKKEVSLKDMATGSQSALTLPDLIKKLSS